MEKGIDYSYDTFRKNAVIRFFGLDKYQYIRKRLYEVDISKDIKGFQKSFNAFYRVRGRDEKWRQSFYDIFEKVKWQKDIDFEVILKKIFQATGRIEASFASKMLATINPDKPIWDRYIIENFQLELIDGSKENRINNIVNVYKKLEQIENELLRRSDVKKTIETFRQNFEEYNLSDIKIIDFIVWNTRDNEKSQ